MTLALSLLAGFPIGLLAAEAHHRYKVRRSRNISFGGSE